jgi:DNA-binding NarL/FixJ family response regulator
VSRPPLVLVTAAALATRLADELAGQAWTVRFGWTGVPEDWLPAGRRLVVGGRVRDLKDARAAVLAAARGAGVLALVDGTSEVAAQLFDDLSRLGEVEVRGAGPEPQALDAEQRAVLELVAAGATLPEAAARLNFSLRTVNRRLAAARARLGVRTTPEAVTRFRRDSGA